MPQDYAASVQGVAIRVTRLDEFGNLLNGPSDSYTTSAFIRTSFTPEYEAGDEITEKAADGTVCVSFKAPDTLKRVNLEIAICDPDPELSALMSGGLMLSGPVGTGAAAKEQVQGWASAQVGEDPSGNGVAVEVWSRAIQNGKPAGSNPFFRWVFPFVKTRLSGDRVIENGLLATTFEGYGLGNINFRSGVDESWRWPAATDRPYLYAREKWAPTGLRGFYTWALNKAADGSIGDGSGDETAVPDDLNSPIYKPQVGTNAPGAGNPYPYNSQAATTPDFILSAADFEPDDGTKAGLAEFSASAAYQDVINPAPAVPAAQNAVVYKSRGDAKPVDVKTGGTVTPSTGGGGTPDPLDVTAANAAAAALADLTALQKDTTIGDTVNAPAHDAAAQPAFTTGQYIVLKDSSKAHWTGSAWLVGPKA